jgi:DNA-binding transcriptional ArsR family regulator
MFPAQPRMVPALDNESSAAPVFAALGDETRLRLVARLGADGPLSTTRLASDSAVTRQAITKHLVVLAGAGLVRDHHRGRERIWELNKTRVAAAQEYLNQIAQRWDEALEDLRAFVED